MKYVKMLGLAAVAAAALMAFVGAGTASATALTNGLGETLPAGTEIKAENEGTTTLTTSFLNVTCSSSSVAGKTEQKEAASITGKVETLTFGGCNCTVTVLKKGTLSISHSTGSNGTLSSNGAEVTVQCQTIFGAVHCIYSTENTELGTLTGSATTGATATMDISSAGIPRAPTNPICDEESNWDAKYKVTQPDALNVD